VLGKRSPQTNLFSADQQFLTHVGKDSFYGFLACEGRKLFRDEEFARLYCLDNGRTSVPPSLLTLALLLQTYDRVSDEEAKARADFDVRWKVALGIEIETRPFAKSTLQLFRAQLVIHQEAQALFRRSLSYAKELGYLKGRRMRAALDTSHILGRGAQEDTYNLIAEGIRTLSRELAKAQGEEWKAWLAARELSRFAAESIKGASEVNWDEARSREAFLTGLIADGGRLLEIARKVRTGLEAEGEADQQIAQGADLLTKLLWQDVEPTERGYRIEKGTAADRIPSVHDPEQRHGRKSQDQRFTGHKAAIAVEPESQLITAVAVLAGNAHDSESAAPLVEASESDTGLEVTQVIGDSAYGGMPVRAELGEREVIAPSPSSRDHRSVKGGTRQFAKAAFAIDTKNDVVRCPAGQETRHWQWATNATSQGRVRVKQFIFANRVCQECGLRAQCIRDKWRRGRRITLHPQEEALQQARALEATDYFRGQYRDRVVVEHRNARLMSLGLRQARYFGRAKTLFQLALAVAVANLTLVAGKVGLMKAKGGGKRPLLRQLQLWNALKRAGAAFQSGYRSQELPAKTIGLPPAQAFSLRCRTRETAVFG